MKWCRAGEKMEKWRWMKIWKVGWSSRGGGGAGVRWLNQGQNGRDPVVCSSAQSSPLLYVCVLYMCMNTNLCICRHSPVRGLGKMPELSIFYLCANGDLHPLTEAPTHTHNHTHTHTYALACCFQCELVLRALNNNRVTRATRAGWSMGPVLINRADRVHVCVCVFVVMGVSFDNYRICFYQSSLIVTCLLTQSPRMPPCMLIRRGQ